MALIAFVLVTFIVLALAASAIVTLSDGQEELNTKKPYSLVKTIGSNRVAIGEFNGPQGLTVDSTGNLYVVDSGNKRVQKFAANGTFLAMWNISDADPQSLVGIDVDSDEQVYVADFQRGMIRALSGENTSAIGEFGQPSSDSKVLRGPFGIAVDRVTNEVYITAAGSDGIRKYAANGTLIGQFNENHKNDSRVEMQHTTGVDIDSTGNVYVLAADNPLVNASFVQIFARNGTFLGSWGGEPLKHPNDMAIDSSDTVFIRDSDSKVKVFTKNGTFMKEWGSAGIEKDPMTGSVGIAFDPTDGNVVYISDPGNSQIQKYTKEGIYLSSIGLASSANGQFEDPHDMEFDSQGNIYVADLQNHRIQKFSSNGIFISKWGSYCELHSGNGQQFCNDPDGAQGTLELGDGQFSSPVDIAIDSKDDIYVLDGPDNMRIQKFTSNGTFISKFNIVAENKTSSDTAYVRIVGIVVDSKDNVYAAVNDAFPLIQKFSSNGTFIGGWDLAGPKTLRPPLPEEMQFLGNVTYDEYVQTRTSIPWRIAIDSSDNIYVTAVVDTFWENYHVEKMSNDGILLASWGQAGWCKEEFRDIREMAFDSSDSLHLVDASNDRISKYASNGTFLTLLYPEDIGIISVDVVAMAFDSTGNLYLTQGNTISIFEPNHGQQVNGMKEDTNPRGYYQVPMKIGEGSLTFVPASSVDSKVVCGSINITEKAARFELLTDSIHNDLSKPNAIELVLPDEFISGIYQIKADNGQEIQFEKRQLDNNDTSMLEALDLFSDSHYTVLRLVIPENATFIDIYATTVVPDFGAMIVLGLATMVGVTIAVNKSNIFNRKR